MKYVVTISALALSLISTQGLAQTAPASAITVPSLPKILDPGLPRYAVRQGDFKLMTGIVARGQSIVSFPFAYAKPIRLKTGFHTFLHPVPAGSVGFDAGVFSSPMGDNRVFCFFRADLANPYAQPECVYNANQFTKWASAVAGSNIPSNMSRGDPVSGDIKIDRDDVVIDHAFSLQLVLGTWRKTGLRLSWMSDGREAGWMEMPLGPDGTVVLEMDTGILTLARDPADTSAIVVSYAPATGGQ